MIKHQMTTKVKNITIIVPALSLIYAILSSLGFTGIETDAGGVVYRVIIIAALIYACKMGFTLPLPGGEDSETGRGSLNHALLAGWLGILAFAIFEIHTFAYIYIYKGAPTDLTISAYTVNCAYLFFISATLILIPPIFKIHKIIRPSIVTICTIAMFFIYYAIIISNYRILAYFDLVITILCLLTAVFLFFQADKNSATRLFATSIFIICLLGTANRILLIATLGQYLHDIIISFYPAAYLLIGYALVHMRKEKDG